MPINESSGQLRSNLTREQRRQAEAAIYGVYMPDQLSQHEITPDDIERMRALVAQHDRMAGIREFDLNRPVVEPYSYRPFPKMLYNHQPKAGEPKTTVVDTEEQMEKLTAKGWKKEPPKPETAEESHGLEPRLDAKSAAEAEEMDRRLKEKPKGK